jgi:NADH-quinone oxidoreductase subunit G
MVVYDAERCIMCTRCVRFMDEIAREPQLAVVQRGSHSLISTFPGQPLDSNYSGNTVDICPVGALLNRDFRFQSRVWFVNKSPSICTGCSNGCNVHVESRGNVAYRLLPRRNEEVNQVWMCDEGRLTYHETNEKRAEFGDLLIAVNLLKPLTSGVGISISAQCTNEEAAAAFLLGAALKAERYFLTGKPPGRGDDFLLREDKNPNTRGVKLAAQAFGVTLLEQQPDTKAVIAFRTDGLTAKPEVLVAITQNEFESSASLPCESAYEQDGSFINYYGRLQRFWDSVPAPRGEAAPAWRWAERILTALGFTNGPRSAAAAFAALAERAPELQGVKLDDIPEDGIVLKSLLPAQFAARAPRPA